MLFIYDYVAWLKNQTTPGDESMQHAFMQDMLHNVTARIILQFTIWDSRDGTNMNRQLYNSNGHTKFTIYVTQNSVCNQTI